MIDNLGISPYHRRHGAGGRGGSELLGQGHRLPNENFRQPCGEGNRSARLQHAQHLCDGDFRARREDMPKLAENRVQFCIWEGQLLHVAFVPFDLDLRDARILFRAFQQLWRQVKGRDHRTGPRDRDRHHAGPAGHVQHLHSGTNPGMLGQLRGVIVSNGAKCTQPCFWISLNSASLSIDVLTGDGIPYVSQTKVHRGRRDPWNTRRQGRCVGAAWVSSEAGMSTRAPPQHGPGGMGAPCGQVRGCPRNVQILSVAPGERMCSNLQACCSISDSLSIARLSVNRRSARRCRRMMLPALLRPRGVSSTTALPSLTNRLSGRMASWQGFTKGLCSCDSAGCGAVTTRPSSTIFSTAMLTGRTPCELSIRASSARSPCSSITQSSSRTSSNCSSSASEKISCAAIFPWCSSIRRSARRATTGSCVTITMVRPC